MAAAVAKRKSSREIGYTNFTDSQVRELACPQETRIGLEFTWTASGGAGYGADPAHGVLPVEVFRRLPPATLPNPVGSGGSRYRTRSEAMRALATALDGVPFDAMFEDCGKAI